MGMNSAAADVKFTALIAEDLSSGSSCDEDFTYSDEDLEEKETEKEKEEGNTLNVPTWWQKMKVIKWNLIFKLNIKIKYFSGGRW